MINSSIDLRWRWTQCIFFVGKTMKLYLLLHCYDRAIFLCFANILGTKNRKWRKVYLGYRGRALDRFVTAKKCGMRDLFIEFVRSFWLLSTSFVIGCCGIQRFKTCEAVYKNVEMKSLLIRRWDIRSAIQLPCEVFTQTHG